jgi:hypothetical protein
MKTKYLLNNKYKPLGWFLLTIGLLIGSYILFIGDLNWTMRVFPLLGEEGFISKTPSLEWSDNEIEDELASLLFIAGGLIVAFSKTADEDEFISKIRLESLMWATWVNYIILFFAVLFVFDMPFFNVMIYNMFTVLLLFILKFHYEVAKSKRTLVYEE